ncbi:MAG: hypothetical protein ACREMN_02720 [Gemmatimonadales bacterium]
MLAVMVVPVSRSLAQERRPADTPAADTGEARRLRRVIEERFAQRVQQELDLTPDQLTRLRTTQERFGERRRELLRRQGERRMALRDQMQPGVAADADSVRKLMDALHTGRADLLRLEQDEHRELADFLTPVQRARFVLLRERLQRRVNELRERRRERMGPRRPRGPRDGRPRRPPRGPAGT